MVIFQPAMLVYQRLYNLFHYSQGFIHPKWWPPDFLNHQQLFDHQHKSSEFDSESLLSFQDLLSLDTLDVWRVYITCQSPGLNFNGEIDPDQMFKGDILKIATPEGWRRFDSLLFKKGVFVGFQGGESLKIKDSLIHLIHSIYPPEI